MKAVYAKPAAERIPGRPLRIAVFANVDALHLEIKQYKHRFEHFNKGEGDFFFDQEKF